MQIDLQDINRIATWSFQICLQLALAGFDLMSFPISGSISVDSICHENIFQIAEKKAELLKASLIIWRLLKKSEAQSTDWPKHWQLFFVNTVQIHS